MLPSRQRYNHIGDKYRIFSISYKDVLIKSAFFLTIDYSFMCASAALYICIHVYGTIVYRV